MAPLAWVHRERKTLVMSSWEWSFFCARCGSSAAAATAAEPQPWAACSTSPAAAATASKRGLSQMPTEFDSGTAAWPQPA
eukprot:scaffold219476_cov30-Tisochrysis_lutea.AAC.2